MRFLFLFVLLGSSSAFACDLDQAREVIIKYVKHRYAKDHKIYMGSVRAVYTNGIVTSYEAPFLSADKTGEFPDEPGMIGKIAILDLEKCSARVMAESSARLD